MKRIPAPEFSTLTGALAIHKAAAAKAQGGPERVNKLIDGAFSNGFMCGAADTCRLMASMTDDPDTRAVIEVLSQELIAWVEATKR